MKIYISGPITGTSDYMERFEKAHKYLESLGFSVVNPALVNSNLPNDTSYKQYMDMSFLMLSMCDHIYMLRGFEKSTGACMELNKARELGLKVLYDQCPADMFPGMITREDMDRIKDDLNAYFGVSV